MTRIYVSDSSEPDHLSWLHAGGLGMEDGGALMERLCTEIRHAALDPEYQSPSPLPRLREEVSRILEATLETSGDVPRDIACHIMTSLDPETIELLEWRAPSTQIEPETWDAIAKDLTPTYSMQ